MRGWGSDIAIGVRLAVGGGRTSLVRFALGAVGIAIATFVLLVAASVDRMTSQSDVRELASLPDTEVVAGVDPTYLVMATSEFRHEYVNVYYVHAEGDDHPVPSGMRELPGPGEMVASPALAELLSSADGELLRPRFPDRVVGILDKAAVPAPGDLVVWVGADATLTESAYALAVYRFGADVNTDQIDPGLMAAALLGGVGLLLPVFVFISSVSRIAGAERDRRLSALRLVGAGSRQVRRIAAAESLVSAAAGLVLGTALFLVVRLYAEDIEVLGQSAYTSDVVPDPVVVVLIVVAVPALSVLTALVALRRTIIEPLGVVRQAKPVRRRLWWRLAIIVVGVVLLVTQGGAAENTDLWAWAVSAGAALLLVGVPVLLPWLIERVAGRLEGGPPSWQLAIRRLQLDSGTPARVVGGVAVVLAGAIAIQTVLMTVQSDTGLAATRGVEGKSYLEVSTDAEYVDDVRGDLSTVPSVRAAHPVWGFNANGAGDDYYYIEVMDCAAIRDILGVDDCVDGEAYQFAQASPGGDELKPATTVEIREYLVVAEGDETKYTVTGTWTAPDRFRFIDAPADGEAMRGSVVLTPGALAGVRYPEDQVVVHVDLDGSVDSDTAEQVRNALAGLRWRAHVWVSEFYAVPPREQETFVGIRTALYAGAVFTLLLAGVSLLVLALEHIRERRRPLAMLAASGVQRGVLARSLLWQVTLPIALGVVVAVGTGLGLAWLIMRLSQQPLTIDWAAVGLLSGGAILLSVLVSAMTLPFLRGATRLTSLRTE
jgi:hypothetical protein